MPHLSGGKAAVQRPGAIDRPVRSPLRAPGVVCHPKPSQGTYPGSKPGKSGECPFESRRNRESFHFWPRSRITTGN
jgi:hypothetical protein